MSMLVDTTIHKVRKISTSLRPGVLDHLGIVAALEWQSRDFQKRTGIRCNFNSSLEDIRLSEDHSTAIFRIFQEALTNVARHARATRINVSLKENTGNLILTIEDNGKGIAGYKVSDRTSLGLIGMRERALLFGGALEVNGVPRKGTIVTLRTPLEEIDSVFKNPETGQPI